MWCDLAKQKPSYLMLFFMIWWDWQDTSQFLLEVQDHFLCLCRGNKYNRSPLLQAEHPLSLIVHSKNIISWLAGCFLFFLAMPCSLWDLSSPTRDRFCAPAVEVWILTTELPGKSLKSSFSLTGVHYHFPNLGFIDTHTDIHTDTHTQWNTHTHPWRAVRHTHTPPPYPPIHTHTHPHPPIHTHTPLYPPIPLEGSAMNWPQIPWDCAVVQRSLGRMDGMELHPAVW